MEIEKACYIVNNTDKLEEIIEKLIKDKKLLEMYKENASKFAGKDFFNENKLIDIINSKLKNNA